MGRQRKSRAAVKLWSQRHGAQETGPDSEAMDEVSHRTVEDLVPQKSCIATRRHMYGSRGGRHELGRKSSTAVNLWSLRQGMAHRRLIPTWKRRLKLLIIRERSLAAEIRG